MATNCFSIFDESFIVTNWKNSSEYSLIDLPLLLMCGAFGVGFTYTQKGGSSPSSFPLSYPGY